MVMHETDWTLLDRYLAGDCTPEERARAERWIDEAPERARLVELMRGALREPERRIGVERRAEMVAAIRREFAAARGPVRVRPIHGFATRSRWAPALRAAAVILVVAGAALAGRVWLWSGDSVQVETALRTVTTPRGQRATFELPDGTRVILGPASTLRHAVAFAECAPAGAGCTREVRLEGEAYFDVRHDERRPFVVRARDIVARDLGTQFIVRAHPEDLRATVVVREGLVALRAAADTTAERVIHPGEEGRLLATGEPVVEPADTAAAFAWTEGSLVFADTPLREALPRLARWYDLELRLADSTLGDIRLSATLRTQPSDEALALLARSLGLEHERRGQVVTFERPTPGR